MSDMKLNLEMTATDKGLRGTVQKSSEAVEKLTKSLSDADKQLGRYIDQNGRMREANGRFVKDAEKASDATEKLGNKTKEASSSSDGFTKSLKSGSVSVAAWGATMAAATVTAVGVAVALRTNTIREMTILSETLDTSVQSISEWQYAAGQMGIESEKVGDIFKDTSDKIGDFITTGGGEAADLFENLNIKVKDLQDLSPDQQLIKIGAALDGIENRSQKIFLLESLADDASRLLPLLEDNGAELSRLQNEARILGISVSDIDAQKISQASIAFGKIKSLSVGATNQLTAELAPVLSGIADKIFDVSLEAGGFRDAMKNAVDVSISGLGYLLDMSKQTQINFAYLKLGAIAIGQKGTEAMVNYGDTVAKVINTVLIPYKAWITSTLDLLAPLLEKASKFAGPFSDELKQASKALSLFSQDVKDYSVTTDDLKALNDKLVGSLNATASEIEALLNSPNPSEGLKKWLVDVREKADKAARTVLSIGESAESSNGTNNNSVNKELEAIIKKADPAAAKIKEVREEIETLYKAVENGELDKADADKYAKALGDSLLETEEKVDKQFAQIGDRVAGTLQDAIATGEWQGVGETVGGVFAGSMAGIVTDTLTEAMGSSSFADVLGPVAGGLVGGLVGSVLGGLFDNSYVDPTEGRQASQGTGTVLGAIDEKSGSIANSNELIANTTSELVNINTEMLKALTGVQNAIQDFGGAVARSQFTELQQINDRNLRDTVTNVRFGLVDPEDDSLLVRMAEEAFASVGSGRIRVDDSGIDILGGALSDILNDTIEGSIVTAYADIRRVRDYDSDKKASLAVELGEDVNSAFIDVLEGIVESIGAGAGSLGIDQSVLDDAIENLTIDAQKLSTQGLTGDEVFEEYNAIFSTTFDTLTRQVIPYLGDMQQGLETLGETLTRVSTQFELSKEAAQVLGFQIYQTMGELSPSLKDFVPFGEAVSLLPIPMEMFVKTADDLVSKAGGIEAFSSALSSYEKNFLSAEEQTSNTARRLTQAMGDLPFPETREGFIDLMQQQQVMTESGRENIATLLKLEDAASAYYAVLEARAEEERDLTIRMLRLQGNAQQALSLERQKELDATDASNRALLERIYLLEDEQAAADAIKLNVNNAFVALNRSITAELDALRESHDLRVDAIQEEIDLVSETVSSIAGFRQSISSTLDDIYQTSFFDQSDYIDAQKSLFDYLADIKSGEFVVPDKDATAKVLRTLSGNSASNYASAVDFQRDQRLTSNALQEVLSLTDGQLTIEEQTLQSLEDQLATEQSSYDIAVKDLQQTREYWQQEIDAINGVDSAVESLETALINLGTAMQEAWENIGITNQNIRDWLAAQGPQLTVSDVQSAIQQTGVTNSQVANALDLVPDGSFAGTGDDIRHWLDSNQGASDVDIATAMRVHDVSIDQVAGATGLTVGDVRDRYLETVPQQVQHQASLPQDAGLPDEIVAQWLADNPNASHEETAMAMQEHGVTPEQVARVRGTSVKDEEFIYLTAIDGSHANGLDRVPYDGYVAELHQGEMVLPREQSDYLRSGELAAQIEYLRAEIRQLREDSNARLDDVIEHTETSATVLSDSQRQGMPTYDMEAV